METQTTPPTPHKTPFLEKIRQTQDLTLGLLFMIMLMDVMGMTLLFPVLAFIVQEYSSDALTYILLNVIYSAAQFFAAPVLGNLSDRFGRRPILLICLLGAAAGYTVFGLAGALWILFLSRLIAGITGGSISTASAYIVDVSKPEDLTRRLALVGMAWGVGLVLGPALGGMLGQIDLRAPAFSAAAFSLISLALGFFVLPESLPKERRVTKPIRASDFNAFASVRSIGRLPGLAVLLVVLSIFNFGFNGMNSTESLFLIARFTAQPWQIGLVTMMGGISLGIVQALLVQRLVRRYGEKSVAVTSLLLLACGALATCFAPALLFVYPIVFLRSAASGFVFPTLGALSTRRVSASEQGALMGVTTALGSLMGIFSPLLSGAFFDLWSPSAPYWTAAALFAAAALLLQQKTAGLRKA